MKSILAIDDQVEILKILVSILEEKYDIFPAKTTTKAFSLMHKHRFDLILLDMMMPGMTGIQFLEYVRTQEYFEDTPVTFVTSEADPVVVAQAAKLGVKGYILKPIEKDKLLKTVKDIIGE